MPKTIGDFIDVQTHVGTHERFDILNLDTPEPGEFTYVSFKSQKFNTWIRAEKNSGNLTGSHNRKYTSLVFWLYKE